MQNSSKYHINLRRDTYMFGNHVEVERLAKVIKPLHFINPILDVSSPPPLPTIHFIISIIDYTDTQSMQIAARMLNVVDSPTAYKVAFSSGIQELSQEQLLFSNELDCRFVAYGIHRDRLIRDYLKRICIDTHQTGSLETYEVEIEEAYIANDKRSISKTIERLKKLPASGEDFIKLLATAYMYIDDSKMMEHHLKKLLSLNPQHLWAANALGKMYLNSGRASEGIEVLRKLSEYHDLNGERLLSLGDAFANAGEGDDAFDVYLKGDALGGGDDPRFKTGLVKAKLAQKDPEGALSLVGHVGFNHEVISFLNMRAVICARTQKIAEAMELYDWALKGVRDRVIRAKVYFNKGLAALKGHDLKNARKFFAQSVSLGGLEFAKGQRPLEIVTRLSENPSRKSAEAISENIEFEALY
jgi:tetratricopeptide (TPR) repeat protein